MAAEKGTSEGAALAGLAYFPLTAPQRDIWVAHARFPGLPQFNVYMYQRFEGQVEVGILAECLTRALQRNDALRLRFGEKDGIPFQWADDTPSRINLIDLSGAPDPAAECLAWINDSYERPVGLGQDAPVEATIIRESQSAVYAYVQAHHIVADAWGLNLFFDQVRADYAHAVRTGTPLESSPPSYLALAAGEDTYHGSAQQESDRRYFQEILGDISPPLFDRKAPSGSRVSARHVFSIARAHIDKIRARGESPFSVVCAALAMYLAKVHGSADVVIGIPMLNRHGMTERQTVGHFVNTLPLRITASRDNSARELVSLIQDASRILRQHERLAIGDILRDRHGGDGRQLFDVTLSYVQLPRAREIPGLRHEIRAATRAHDHEVLAIVVEELDDISDVRVEVDYALDVFGPDCPVESLARHVLNLIAGIVEQPEQPISDIPMVDEAERADLIWRRNATATEYPAAQTLHGLFAEQAARTPDEIAIVAPGSAPLSYAALDARANGLAHALRDDGIGPDDIVAIAAERSPEMLIAILGVLKAGGAYLPVDPGYPAERIRFLLQDSQARVAVTGPGSPGLPPGLGLRVYRTDQLPSASARPPTPAASPASLAYVIYTSGSTGQPKGVMVEHTSIVNRLTWMQRRYPIGPGHVLLQKTPISFDVSVWELFWWGLTGARLAVPPPGAEKDPREILRVIGQESVTVVHFVPSMLAPFLDLIESAPELREEARSLRYVFCSGEALPPSLVTRFRQIVGPAGPGAPTLVNLYGPTEATVDVSYYDCPRDPARPVTRVPIGAPIDNTRLYVLDFDDAPAPVGIRGELCISGVGVARGYLGRPELTEEKFVTDPFTPGARMYRTGDLARWLHDGNLEYLGRIDGQVKIRGNRVELGEVEHRMATLPGVRGAVVVDRQSPGRGVYLAGYYVSDEPVDPALIRAHLGAALPEFMVPAYFARIDQIPLTPNGKADRRALPEPPWAGPAGGAAATGPAADGTPCTPAEQAIAEIWAEILGVASVGVTDDYFALGGDSILMLQIRARAARRGLHFSLADMVANPTVATLAPRAAAAPAPGSEHQVRPFELVPSIDRAGLAGAQDAFPATRMQVGVLYHSREHEHSAVYHDVFRYTFAVAWDEAAFRWAFDRLAARHPILRSSFDLGGYSEPLQIVHAEARGGLSVADLRSDGEEAAERRIREHIQERRLGAYDFGQPPLYHFRAHVRESVLDLVFSFHHAILDGWSAATLIRELLQDYRHRLTPGVEPVPPGAPPSPAAYVLEERRALARDDSRQYWLDTLAGAELVQIDPFVPHEPPGPGEISVRYFDLPTGLDESVRQFAAAHAVPARSVYLAAHCLMLRLLAGAEDVTTGLFTHGRAELANAERVIGLFINTMPIRLPGGQQTWLAVVRDVLEREQQAHPHRRYPLSAIQADRGGDAVLEIAFNYVHLHVLDALRQMPGLDLLDVQAFEETNFELIVHLIVDPRDQRLRLRLDCDGRRFSAAQTDLLARTYLGILGQIAAHPGDPVSFEFLIDPPRQVVLSDLPPQDAVSRFEAQVARQPDKVAVAGDGQEWTYRQLGASADSIARQLLRLGAGHHQCVGILMDRSPEMIAAVMGILKTGAACVPLDVAYPAQRIAAMVETAQPLQVIAHSRHAGLLPDQALLMPIESIPSDAGDGPGITPFPQISLEDTACILFTSGSSGRPKAAELPHRPFAYYLDWQIPAPSGAAGDKTLQFAPLSFDVSFQEIFSTLGGGGTLQLISDEERRNPATLARLLDATGVARIFIPYVALQQLAETADTLGIRPRRLRVIISSGEQLRVTDEIRRLCAGLPGTILENQYGPTETHLVSKFTMTGDPAAFPALPPVGSPMPYLEVHVLDKLMRPVPPGVAGEVYVGGVGLAHGYRGQPEATAKAFVRHHENPGARLYRIGDLVRVLPGGDMVYLGRVDNQVKVRGFRVEPAEVEFALLAQADDQPGIREAAVVARRRDAGDAFLAAFLVGDPSAANIDDIRRRLRAMLPEHMIPSFFTWLPRLPLTPSGKRDDAALRTAPLTAQLTAGHAAPRDEHERALLAIFAELLSQPGMGVHDDFFAAGGTSLTAMRLIVMIEKRFGVKLGLATLVAAPTVAELAESLRHGTAMPAFDPVVPIRADGRARPLFLVHPLGGNVLCYVRLAEHLPGDQPLYALQAAGATPGTEALTSMESLADSYIAAMRRVQPEGPYTIGGWSFGGFVAFEMARRLRMSGAADVERVILLDTISPASDARRNAADSSLIEWFYWELLWTDKGGEAALEGLPSGLATNDHRLDFIAGRAVAAGILPGHNSRAAIRRLFQVYVANWTALMGYHPDGTDVDVTLLKATEPLPEVLWPMHGQRTAHQDPANGWGSFTTGRVDVIPVPGDHLVLLDEPHVRSVARAITDVVALPRHQDPREGARL